MQQPLMKQVCNRQKQQGYILIELAVVVVVLSIMMAVMFPVYETYKNRNAVKETTERMKVVSKAFSSYAQVRHRLPCPAAPSVAAGAQLGLERAACDVNVPDAHGIVPYRTLGIPEQYAKDGYGNFFTYVVSPDFTTDNRLGGPQPDQVHVRLSHLVGGDNITGNYALLPSSQFCAPIAATGTDITVQNAAGNDLYDSIAARTAVVDLGNLLNSDVLPRGTSPDANLNRDMNVTAVAMALISHGENGGGAYQSSGAQSPVTGGAAEQATANNADRIIQVEANLSNTGANEYDDIVLFFTQDEIYAAAGRSSCEHL